MKDWYIFVKSYCRFFGATLTSARFCTILLSNISSIFRESNMIFWIRNYSSPPLEFFRKLIRFGSPMRPYWELSKISHKFILWKHVFVMSSSWYMIALWRFLKMNFCFHCLPLCKKKKYLLRSQNVNPFSKCWSIFKMLTNFQNVDPFSKTQQELRNCPI